MILVPTLLWGKSIRNCNAFWMYFSHRYFIDHPVLHSSRNHLSNKCHVYAEKKSGSLLSPNQNFCTAHCLGKSDQRTCPDDYKVRLIDVSVHPHGPPSGLGIKAYTGTSATQKERRPGRDFCWGGSRDFADSSASSIKKVAVFWDFLGNTKRGFNSIWLCESLWIACVRVFKSHFFSKWILWYFSPCEGFLNPLHTCLWRSPQATTLVLLVGAQAPGHKKNCPISFKGCPWNICKNPNWDESKKKDRYHGNLNSPAFFRSSWCVFDF